MNETATLVLLAYLGCAAATGMFTPLAIGYAKMRGLIDQPDVSRRSHTTPVPRGGGIVMIAVLICALLLLFGLGSMSDTLTLGLVVGLLLVGTVGWVDDHRPLSPWVRLGVHLLAAGVFVGLNPPVPLEGAVSYLTAAGAVLALVWFINLYNFMDGTDGLAGVQASLWGIGLCIIVSVAGFAGLGIPAACIAGVSSGFLIYNLPPAKVFMGDVGSGGLGFAISAVSIWIYSIYSDIWAVLLLLVSVFSIDATATLLMRFWRGDRWYNAHREHAYQLLVRMGRSHAWVLGIYAGLNVVVVWPLAFAAGTVQWAAALSVGLAGVLLMWLWWRVQRQFRLNG